MPAPLSSDVLSGRRVNLARRLSLHLANDCVRALERIERKHQFSPDCDPATTTPLVYYQPCPALLQRSKHVSGLLQHSSSIWKMTQTVWIC